MSEKSSFMGEKSSFKGKNRVLGFWQNRVSRRSSALFSTHTFQAVWPAEISLKLLPTIMYGKDTKEGPITFAFQNITFTDERHPQAFFVRNPSKSLEIKCRNNEFRHFENEFHHFENEFHDFGNEF